MGRSVRHCSFKTAAIKNVSERSQTFKIDTGAFNNAAVY